MTKTYFFGNGTIGLGIIPSDLSLSLAANPAVIPNAPFLTLNDGSQGSSRPSLQAFVSGTPFPEISQGTWLFNGMAEFPPSTSPFERELILSAFLTHEHSGMYTYTVRTSAGNTTANFIVTVIGELLFCLGVELP